MSDRECKGCGESVRLAEGEVARILDDYLRDHPEAVVADEQTRVSRLSVCRACPDLRYGTTCRHCGCLVEVRASLAGSSCPASSPRWHAAGIHHAVLAAE